MIRFTMNAKFGCKISYINFETKFSFKLNIFLRLKCSLPLALWKLYDQQSPKLCKFNTNLYNKKLFYRKLVCIEFLTIAVNQLEAGILNK